MRSPQEIHANPVRIEPIEKAHNSRTSAEPGWLLALIGLGVVMLAVGGVAL